MNAATLTRETTAAELPRKRVNQKPQLVEQPAVLEQDGPCAPMADEHRVGVIATMVEVLKSGQFTQAELYSELVKRFPDRATPTGGMRITVGIQLGALVKKGYKIAHRKTRDRGTVYFIRGRRRS